MTNISIAFYRHLIPIDGKQVKRFSYIAKGDDWTMKTTYGLTRSTEENIFHMSTAVDARFPGCKLIFVRHDEPSTGRMSYNKILFIRDKLTSTEHTIFDKWELNLKTSLLPITTSQEAAKAIAKIRFGF